MFKNIYVGFVSTFIPCIIEFHLYGIVPVPCVVCLYYFLNNSYVKKIKIISLHKIYLLPRDREYCKCIKNVKEKRKPLIKFVNSRKK